MKAKICIVEKSAMAQPPKPPFPFHHPVVETASRSRSSHRRGVFLQNPALQARRRETRWKRISRPPK